MVWHEKHAKQKTRTGLRNGIRHESEAGKNLFLRPDLLRNHDNKSRNQAKEMGLEAGGDALGRSLGGPWVVPN